MNEIKSMNGMLNILDSLFEEPVETFTRKKTCPIHGEYEFTVSRYKDGREVFNDACPMCENERQEREEKTRKENPEYIDVVDTCTLMRNAGFKVRVVEGNRGNIKVTTPSDYIDLLARLSAEDQKQIFELMGAEVKKKELKK